MQIRELTKSDLPSLLSLYKQLDSINDNLSLTQSEQIPNITHGGKSICYIENVVTDVDYRKQGLGRRVIQNGL